VKWFGLATIIFVIAACFASAALAQNCGKVSDGSCNCKTQCDGGRSTFSPGHTVAQCRACALKPFRVVREDKSGVLGAICRRCGHGALLLQHPRVRQALALVSAAIDLVATITSNHGDQFPDETAYPFRTESS
jgi:hypothetical protein